MRVTGVDKCGKMESRSNRAERNRKGVAMWDNRRKVNWSKLTGFTIVLLSFAKVTLKVLKVLRALLAGNGKPV